MSQQTLVFLWAQFTLPHLHLERHHGVHHQSCFSVKMFAFIVIDFGKPSAKLQTKPWTLGLFTLYVDLPRLGWFMGKSKTLRPRIRVNAPELGDLCL